jgi:hypothetical protein
LAHTTSRGAASWTSPFIVMAMVDLPLRLFLSKARLNAKGRGWRNGSRDIFAGTAVLIDPGSLAPAGGLAEIERMADSPAS